MQLYNTLTRKIEELTPLSKNKIKMYTCGLTVYSQPHIGNWVSYIYSDILFRYLRLSGYEVLRIQNITDVGHLVSDDDSGEDKMQKGAKKEGLNAWQLAEKYIKIADNEAYDQLNLLRPDKLVRATDLIAEQIEFTEQLEAKDYTYLIPNEGVYFDTTKLDDYGKLAKLDIAGLRAGARVDIAGKKNPTDFALWKLSPKNQKRDMEWDSPWGVGFPGWHLECSVIARENLGDQLDIHTGGIDHIPVHHTNEIAQTESLTGKQFVQTWFHNNHIKVDNTKLAKSLGNSYSLADLAKKGFDPMSFKYMVLSSHYRVEGNFSWEILESYKHRLQSLRDMSALRWQASRAIKPLGEGIKLKEVAPHVMTLLGNDLDTPAVVAYLSQVSDQINKNFLSTRNSNYNNVEDFKIMLEELDQILGLELTTISNISKDQNETLKARSSARQQNDWAKSDKLRDILLGQGIHISDTAIGQIWTRV